MSQQTQISHPIPTEETLRKACNLALQEDKPVLFDYWLDSLNNTCCIGIRESTKEKLLVKSSDAYTSCIDKFFKTGNEYVIVTENSIYIVSNTIKPRKIS